MVSELRPFFCAVLLCDASLKGHFPRCRNANAYWSTDVLPYFPYASNHCPHGGAGGGHCILPDEQIWDYKLLQSTLQYLDHAMKNYKNTSQPFFLMTGFRDPVSAGHSRVV
jgi:hypothetical protein